MNVKKNLEKCIQGWLPKETASPTTVSAQVSQKTRRPLSQVYLAIFGITFGTALIVTVILYGLGLGNAYVTFTSAAVGVLASIVFSVLSSRKSTQNKPLTKEAKKAAATIGVANAAMGGVFLGTYVWVNPLISSGMLALGLWIILLFTLFAINHLLSRNLKKQIGLMEAAM
jgi:ABC-type antimicrobial peptide transport system permease subunit